MADPTLKTNLAAGALTSTHFTVRTLMPLLLGALATAGGFSESQLGNIGAAYSLGATLVALSSVLWLGRALRVPVACFLALGSVPLATLLFVSSYTLILGQFFLSGMGFGGIYVLMTALLMRAKEPTRAIGWQWALGSLPGVLLVYMVPRLGGPASSLEVAVAMTLATNLLFGLAVIALPRSSDEAAAPEVSHLGGASHRTSRSGLWIALGGLCLIYVGGTGVWAFLGRIATHKGLSASYAGGVLAIATAACSVMALMAAESGAARTHRVLMTGIVAAMLVGLALIGGWPSATGYAIGTVMFIGLSACALTFSASLVSRLDTAGTASGMPAAALGVGAILGPSLAGYVYQSTTAELMLLVCAGSLLLGLAAYLTAARNVR